MVDLNDYWIELIVLFLIIGLSIAILFDMIRRVNSYKRIQPYVDTSNNLPDYDSVINMGPPPSFDESLDTSTHVATAPNKWTRN